MFSVVGICNLALSNLGDRATVVSIDPPEGSAQAERCKTYWPLALRIVLEAHEWGFATKRVKPAQLAQRNSAWAYHYALPHDALRVFAVLPPNAPDDYEVNGQAVTADYQTEHEDGQIHILTDQREAVVRYLANIDDPALFPATFVAALSWQLASMLAGPVLKGEAGKNEAKSCERVYANYLGLAISHDSKQRKVRPRQQTPWIQGRS